MTTPAGLYRERLDISLPITLLSPLHVGSVEARLFPAVTNASGGEPAFQVAEVLTTKSEHGLVPFIPGASLKGVLRALFDEADAAGKPAVRRLFGWASDNDQETSEMGLLFVHSALPAETRQAAVALAAARRRPMKRTALDPDTGAVAGAKLFSYDTVPAGTVFSLRLRLLLPSGRKAEAEADLLSLLRRVCAEPLRVGRGSKIGQGRAEADLDQIFVKRLVWTDGRFVPSTEAGWAERVRKAPLGAATAVRRSFKLRCDGPYISKDPFAEQPVTASRNVIEARVDGDGRAELLPSSFLGALRQRAVWQQRPLSNRPDRPDTPLRRRYLEEREAGESLADFVHSKLTTVERLFGINGFRGLLRIERLACVADEGTISLTSVALDRFSMAPKHGALYTVRARLRPRFEVVITVERRRPDLPTAADLTFLDALLQSFTADDLLLGYGTTKGFGWFRIEELKNA